MKREGTSRQKGERKEQKKVTDLKRRMRKENIIEKRKG